MSSGILVNVIRGETVESIHRGHIVIVDGNGGTVAAVGDPSTVSFYRSAAKPFQAMPCITGGAADRFGFDIQEIAMACASHSGEPVHVKLAAGMLSKIGLSHSDLHCGTHLPFYTREAHRMIAASERATELHNNCSGKHIAMLALAKHIGADIADYESIDNPVQQEILKSISAFSGIAVGEIAIGTDGCAVPNFAVPLIAMARSFARLVYPSDFDENTQDACRRIVKVMSTYPEIIGGTDRLDTILMQATPGKLISKVGADGVWLCAVLPSDRWPSGLGIAIKIEDGDDLFSRSVTAVEILRQLGILETDGLADQSPKPIKNRRGDIVGRFESVFDLQV